MKSKVVKAKRKIIAHVRQKGENSDFIITDALAMYWWRELNFALFEGKLYTPNGFIIKDHFRDDWGWCHTDRFYSKNTPVTFGLSQELDDRGFFLAILAHEMVHQWEQQTYGRMTHGKRFWSWKDKIERLGLDFAKSY